MIDALTVVATFCERWPGMYVNPCWPTPDHVIPWRLFWGLLACAQERPL